MNVATSLKVPTDIPPGKREVIKSLHQRLLKPELGMTSLVRQELDEVLKDLDEDETDAVTRHLAYLQEHVVNGHALNTFRQVRLAFTAVLGEKAVTHNDGKKVVERNVVRDYFDSTNFITENLLLDDEFEAEIATANTGEEVVELVEMHTQDDRSVLQIRYSSYFLRRVIERLMREETIKESLGSAALAYVEDLKTKKKTTYA